MATVRLWNRGYENGVNIEVRVGNADDCNQNAPRWSGNVAYGSCYPVQAENETVCYAKEIQSDMKREHSANRLDYEGWTKVEVFTEDKDENI
jgi:hypothetical protein